MGTKMAVAISVIYMAHVEKQLLLSSPHKLIIWKRFIDDIFSVWTSSKQEINSFVDFANRFHATIKFTCEMSSERAIFLDTEVFKGPRFASNKIMILDVQTHFKATKRSNTLISLHATPSASKRVLLKERHFVCYERTQLKRNSSQANGNSNSAYSKAPLPTEASL